MLSVTYQNGNLNPFRYRGYYYDSETGLYYLMSRYYDPVTHRFINADGYFQSGGDILDANMSAYCANNPINFYDPTGTKECPIHHEYWDPTCVICRPEYADTKNNIALYSEHSKKGTTNKANKNKHENGQARKNRDQGGEKADSRRKSRSNKRHIEINDFEYNYYDYDNSFEADSNHILEICAITACTIAIIAIAVDDASGFGIADDVAIVPLAGVIWDCASSMAY